MSVQHEFGWDHAFKFKFNIEHGLAGRETRAVADAEHMGVHRHRVFTESHVEHDIGCLAAGTGQRLEFGARARYDATEIADQLFRQRNDVLGLGAIKTDGLDVVTNRLLAEIDHLLRRIGDGEQCARRLVDAGIRRLRGQHHGDQQRVGIEMFELALGLGIGLAEA